MQVIVTQSLCPLRGAPNEPLHASQRHACRSALHELPEPGAGRARTATPKTSRVSTRARVHRADRESAAVRAGRRRSAPEFGVKGFRAS